MDKKRSPESEEYLEALVRYEEQGRSPKVKELAHDLKVSSASVSEMLRKLSARKLVECERYGPVRLTPKGKKLGLAILRKHRFMEKFLIFIGVKKDRIHEEACILEHALSDEVEEALRSKFSGCTGDLGDVRMLTQMKKGERGRIILVKGGRSACRRLTDLGLTPGTKIEVSRASSRVGPMELSIRSSFLAVGRGIADKIFVEVDK